MAKKVGNTYYFTGKGKSSGGGGGGGDAVLYTEQTLTESQQMQARKNQGLYYEETTEGEQTYIRGDNYAGGKISDNVPTQNDIISLDSTPASELYFTTIEYGYTIATSANPQRDQEVVTVYTEDFDDVTKGIYFHEVQIFGGTWAEELHWYGTATTVHQIPAKYIPSTGLDVFEIEFSALNPQQLGEAELPNYTYEQIQSAIESGKLLVLTLKQEGMSENEVWGRYIGGQLSRMYNPESDYGMPCIRIPAAYSYLDQTIQGKFNSTIVKDIVIYNDWPAEADEPTLMITVEDSFTNQ